MTPPTFRVFISSTFSDLKAERNALRELVYPRLQALCMRHGCHFQAIDLRWGVSEEAAVNQQTMRICLQELERCQVLSPRPNFIILLGNRYGWRPLPEKIESSEFEELLRSLPVRAVKHLMDWYRRDDNAVPCEYCLLPREGTFRDGKTWNAKERALHRLLLEGINNANWPINDKRRLKYEASATHQEIIKGALNVADANEQVFCFFREICRLPLDRQARDYIDCDDNGQIDTESQKRLIALKNELRQRLPDNTFDYTADWSGNSLASDHLEALCEKVYDCLANVIEKEISRPASSDPVAIEAAAHARFYAGHARIFVGQTSVLNAINNYVNGPSEHPLILYGPPGCGKSAIMAKASQGMEQRGDGISQVIVRSIGATPASSNIRSLLQGLCGEICQRNGKRQTAIPSKYSQVLETFQKLISQASLGNKIVLFIDALDQLEQGDAISSLGWLPNQLAPNVKLIVSFSSAKIDQNASIEITPDYFSLLSQRMPSAMFVPVGTMPPEEAEILLNLWLSESGRTLQPLQKQEILNKFCGCPYPLYLRLAFEAARRWHSFDKVGIKATLSCDIPGLLNELLTRLELAENHGKLLVTRALGYLAASRNGLSEDELMDVLSADPEVISDFHRRSPDSPVVKQLPTIVWSRLRADIEPYLMQRQSGEALLLTFYHQLVIRVVFKRYLSGETLLSAHSQLANYFINTIRPADSGLLTKANPRALSEMPYHQYHGHHYPALMETLSSKEYVDAVCMVLGQESMLEILELGLAAAREEQSVPYAVTAIVTWGYVFTAASLDFEERIKDEIESGQIVRAIRIISNRMPSEQAGSCLVREAHQALDRNDLHVAAEFVHAFLRIQPPHSTNTMRDQLKLVDRLAAHDFPEYLNILLALKPEDTGVRILLFLSGTTHFSLRLVDELKRILLQIDEPYWRGICQFALCCRSLRHGLSQATDLARDLRETLRMFPRTQARSELVRLCARSYRWLRHAGFSLQDLDHPEINKIEEMPSATLPVSTIFADASEKKDGAFDFLPEIDAVPYTLIQSNWLYIIQRALGALADTSADTSSRLNGDICQDLEKIFSRLSAGPEKPDEQQLFYYSLLPADIRKRKPFQPRHPFDLRRMNHDARIQVLFSLRRLGELKRLRSLLSEWSNSITDDREYIEFCQTLQELHQAPGMDIVLCELAQRLSQRQDTLDLTVITALIDAFLRCNRTGEALFWMARLRSIMAPSMEINRQVSLEERTTVSYALLNVALPPVPENTHAEYLKPAAADWANRLIQTNRQLGWLLAEEYGVQTPPLGYLLDRILAFWAENIIWNSRDETSNLDYLSGILKLGIVNDDRERLRSWFFWLLVLSSEMSPPQFARWREGVQQARAIHLRHEKAFYQIFNLEKHRYSGKETEPKTPQIYSSAQRLEIFKSIASMLGPDLVKANNQIYGEWTDAALRIFSEQADQALAFSFLAEASARIDQIHTTEAYLATVQALDEDLIEFARERVALAALGQKKDSNLLGQWMNPHSFKEAFQTVQRSLLGEENREDLLRLTKYLSQVPDLWGSLLLALCATNMSFDERLTISRLFLKQFSGIDAGKNQEINYAPTK